MPLAALQAIARDEMSDKTRRQALEEMLAEDPNDEFLRYGLGMEYVSTGDLENAVRVFRELLALHPAKPYIPAFQMAAQSLVKLGRRADAISILKQGIAEARKQNQQHPLDEMQTLLDSVE
jgi:predicted Zn-dependent protease